MKAYLLSLMAGEVAGLVCCFRDVRSPAPPTVALAGLLGMLGGERLFPRIRQLVAMWSS